MILPMLMGASPVAPVPLCLDCGSYFWLGLILGIGFSIALALAALHFFKR